MVWWANRGFTGSRNGTPKSESGSSYPSSGPSTGAQHTRSSTSFTSMIALEDRFWPKVHKTSTCWLWAGALTTQGYPEIWDRRVGRPALATHIAWELSHPGKRFPKNKEALHHCDTPRCVRWGPKHCFLGTQQENVQDCVAKRRHPGSRKTHCLRGHPFRGKNLRIRPTGQRACRACLRVQSLRSYYRRKGR
jgi:hypothetical protein